MPSEGYTTITVTEEMVALLDRAKAEHGFGSRRAVIEAMALATGHNTDVLESSDGVQWDEWHAALRASKEIPHPDD